MVSGVRSADASGAIRRAHVARTRMRRIFAIALLALGSALVPPAFAGCRSQPSGDAGRIVPSAEAPPADVVARTAAAMQLVDCLASPDPALRDDLAFGTLQRWMRANAFAPDELRALRDRLQAMLATPDPDGVARPFAALALSEVARTDRVAPWMREDEREAMVVRAAAYLASVDDYRGFRNGEGWRHGVAHGADWAMQLSLNPALQRPQLDALRDAIAVQAVPVAAHAYVFGEPERLARPLLFIARRDLHTTDDWRAWFGRLQARLGDPALAWKDEAWLARRHDLAALLAALHQMSVDGEDPGIARMKPALREAMKALP